MNSGREITVLGICDDALSSWETEHKEKDLRGKFLRRHRPFQPAYYLETSLS
jgi:hypothetical protein